MCVWHVSADFSDSLTIVIVFFVAVNRARSVMNLYDKAPILGRNVFIAPNALVSGDVKVGNNSSVFYGSVVRGTFAYTHGNLAVGLTLYLYD